MFFIPRKTFCLHIPNTGPDRDPQRGHLFVILNDACEKGLHLLVPICGARPRCDQTCLLGKGDHKFLYKDSFVAYNLMDLYSSSDIRKRVDDKIITYEGVMDEKIFARVHEGVRLSRYTARKHRAYLFGE